MPEELKIGGRLIPAPYTIPSGIITTTVPAIKKLAQDIPELGIITTKSIGLKPRPGHREPIIAQDEAGNIYNSVGLANPGADKFKEEIQEVYPLPGNKFLLTSIFASNEKEIKEIARGLRDCTDGFELNLSCPHAEKAGWHIGQDLETTRRFIAAVQDVSGKPVIPKLSPQLTDIRKAAEICQKSGAAAITLINTAGPGIVIGPNNKPVLSNIIGGISGPALLPIGLRCVREAASCVDIPIIAVGGIRSYMDVLAYKEAGASFFGIGTALIGMTTEEIARFFRSLVSEHGNKRKEKDRAALLRYRLFLVQSVRVVNDDLFILTLDASFPVKAGQFFFIYIPGKGEKPFSPCDDDPVEFIIRKVGRFTEVLSSLKKGNKVYLRGPYGNGFPALDSADLVIIAGGTGIAPLKLVAKRRNVKAIVVGLSDDSEKPVASIFMKFCKTVFLAIDKEGEKGRIVKKIRKLLISKKLPESAIYFICGPPKMTEECVRVLLKSGVKSEKIFLAREDYTKCGVGLCGSCATESGLRSCVDGPIFSGNEILQISRSGIKKRGPDGSILEDL